ncbi:MAG: Na+-driven multidrug efflux pump, partial [Lentisphaeria bacterium]
GAGKLKRLYDSQKISAQFCFVSGLTIALILALSGKWIGSFFSQDERVIQATSAYLLIVPVSYFAYGVVMVVNASFNGLGKPMPGVVISSFRVIVVLLPLAYLGNYWFGLWGIFSAIALANLLVGVIGYFWIHKTIAQVGRLVAGKAK